MTDAVSAVAALEDPQRRRLYQVVREADAPVTREDAAAAAGISRKLAAFHLERLVDAGLLDASFDRPSSPVAKIGRTPKRYRASDLDLEVSIPPRHYDLVGEILLDAVEQARAGESPADAVGRVAHERGEQLGSKVRTERRLGRLGPERAAGIVKELLGELGFEPAACGDAIIQRNCPFHRLAHRSPALVCGINQSFVGGLLAGLEASRLRAELDPADGRCCVVVTTG